jgi:hypothetical protein
VINLCPGRHDRIEAPPQKDMNEKNADGKATEGKKTCKNPACRLRQELLNGMIKANEEMAAEIQEMAASLDELKVEADDAEEELEAQKRTLADAEKRTEILDAEEKRLSEQSEFCRSVETIAKNRMTTMEAERQTLARILFESKLKKQGIELTGFEGDGMTLQPSRGFAGAPPDFSEEPKDDHVEGIRELMNAPASNRFHSSKMLMTALSLASGLVLHGAVEFERTHESSAKIAAWRSCTIYHGASSHFSSELSGKN